MTPLEQLRSEVVDAARARVLIVARDDQLAGPLAEGLDRLGWRTITARGGQAALIALQDMAVEVAIVDVASRRR